MIDSIRKVYVAPVEARNYNSTSIIANLRIPMHWLATGPRMVSLSVWIILSQCPLDTRIAYAAGTCDLRISHG